MYVDAQLRVKSERRVVGVYNVQPIRAKSPQRRPEATEGVRLAAVRPEHVCHIPAVTSANQREKSENSLGRTRDIQCGITVAETETAKQTKTPFIRSACGLSHASSRLRLAAQHRFIYCDQ
jgi:hypothetical protein